MAIGTHITVPNGTAFGQKYTAMLNNFAQGLSLLRELKAEADAYTSGGVTTANLENALVNFAAGDGAAAYTNLVNLEATVDVATVTNVLKNMRD